MSTGNKLGNPKRIRGNRRTTKVYGDDCCIVCGKPKMPKKLSNGKIESPYNIMRRKTCGGEWDGKKWVRGECYLEKFAVGEANSNYKGYMPKCKICGKRTSYYSADKMKKGTMPRYCGTCWFKKMKKDKKGIYPEHLKPFAFQSNQK